MKKDYGNRQVYLVGGGLASLAAAVYLEVAPTVVAVARGVDVDVTPGTIAPMSEDRAAAARVLAEKYGYASALERYLTVVNV